MKVLANVILAATIASTFSVAHAQGKGGQAEAPAPAAVVGGRLQPQAKTKAEFTVFQEAISKPTPAEQEIGAMEFALKFPDSDLRSLAFLSTMRNYQNANNAEKTVGLARKVLEYDPNNPEALVTMANVLAERTRETDLDRDERLMEATSAAEKALITAETDIMVPPNLPQERLEAVKNVMKGMAHSALGTVQMAKKNYPEAEMHFDQATQLSAAQPDAVTWLRLAIARENQKKFPQALEAASQALKIAPAGSQAANLAGSQRDRLQKLVDGGAGQGAASTSQ